MDITLTTKKKYVSFYRGEKLVRFWVERSRLRIGFASKNQMPLIMIWREYYKRGKVDYAEVLFSAYLPWAKPYPHTPLVNLG